MHVSAIVLKRQERGGPDWHYQGLLQAALVLSRRSIMLAHAHAMHYAMHEEYFPPALQRPVIALHLRRTGERDTATASSCRSE